MGMARLGELVRYGGCGLVAALVLTQPVAAGAKKAQSVTQTVAPVDASHMEAALDAGRYVQLKTLIERAKLARQVDPRIDLYLAEYWLANGQPEQALAQFEALAANSAVAARAHQGAGVAAFNLGHVDRAAKALQQAVSIDPNLSRAWNALGAAADRQRDWALAEKAYGEALRLDPGSSVVHSNRGYSRMLQGRHDDIGYAAIVRGDYVSAEAYLNRALEVSDVFYRKAWQNLVYLGDLKPAVRLASAR
jgi:Flp pilus assembly protein TadD